MTKPQGIAIFIAAWVPIAVLFYILAQFKQDWLFVVGGVLSVLYFELLIKAFDNRH